MPMHVAILGSGAMGSLFGGKLADSGVPVTLVDVWEEHVAALQENGLELETPVGNHKRIEVEATTDPETVDDVDLVVVFVKSIHTAEAIEDAESLLENADVLTLQNGLGNPETIAEYVEEPWIIAGTTAHGSTLLGPGRIRHAGHGSTTIGRYFVDNDDRIRTIADRLSDAGLPTDVSGKIHEEIWEKVLVNVGINAATALSRVRNGRLAAEASGRRLVEAAVGEATAVARAEGYSIREDIADHVLSIAEQTAENRSSMRQDIEAGRKTEIETLNGEVVRRAEQLGIEVPVNRTLADLVRLAERRDTDD